MDKNIAHVKVRVYKDRGGFYPTPQDQFLDCNDLTDFGRDRLLSTAAEGATCGVYDAGTVFGPDVRVANIGSVGLIDTVKLRAKNGHGFRWVHPTDYDALVASCQNCCGT